MKGIRKFNVLNSFKLKVVNLRKVILNILKLNLKKCIRKTLLFISFLSLYRRTLQFHILSFFPLFLRINRESERWKKSLPMLNAV